MTEAAAKAAAARRGGRESTNDVKALVDQAVDDFFDGDRVGRFDYALQAAGAKVVPSLTSEPYTPRGAIIPTKVWHALGLDAGVGRAADALSSQMSLDGASRLEVPRATDGASLEARAPDPF